MHRHGATPSRGGGGARTHLWQEVYYKFPPSAAVPMNEKRGGAKAKSDGTGHSEQEVHPVLLSSLFLRPSANSEAATFVH